MGEQENQLKVHWSKAANQQFLQVLEYWVNRNKSNSYSLKIIDVVERKLEFISKYPNASKPTDYENLRNCIFGPFSIFYKVEEKQIQIMAFWDNRQNPKELGKLLK
jgi:plasmid stabilization system protein ParE